MLTFFDSCVPLCLRIVITFVCCSVRRREERGFVLHARVLKKKRVSRRVVRGQGALYLRLEEICFYRREL